ncbi:hypothetical protein B296_00030752 [Ensete ventricosum]|uniref:Endonuclease/exonuclease/phosphatase domain-containing protein n=1 Tax=Ensete ventricosum TaxID=4639 RepID=A0A427AI46_ENSVE|nr:hypothetical protein B296_00030752 [Ensete ventricosum]
MSVSISVTTFNLHEGDQPSDSPNSWEKRKDLCVSVITSYSPTILCTQQGLKWQLEYLQQCLPGDCYIISSSDTLKLLRTVLLDLLFSALLVTRLLQYCSCLYL